MKRITLLAASGALLFSCGPADKNPEVKQPGEKIVSNVDKELLEKAQAMFGVLPAEATVTEGNVLSPERIALGKMLYFDTRLSKTGNNSCNSCHNLSKYGVDNEPTSEGDAGKRGDRNSPTVLNAALHFVQFWDGRAKDVEEQAGMPVLNPVEMAIPNESFLVNRLKEVSDYQAAFSRAFPGDKTPVSYTNIRKAIAAFERTLVTPSRFDKYIAGDVFVLSEEERDGLNLFIETGCNQCHVGSTVGGTMFQKFGRFADYREYAKGADDPGKMKVTKNEADKDIFKVPSLRNIEKTGPYFHNGSVAGLDEAVRIMAKVQLNKDLDQKQVSSIVTFLKALTGELPAGVTEAPPGIPVKKQ